MTRDQFYARQRHRSSDLRLAFNNPDAYEHFVDLAVRTYDAVVEAGGKLPFGVYDYLPNSIDFFIYGRARQERAKAFPDLFEEWSAWEVGYESFVERNPAVHLADLMREVSHINDSTSFPRGYEANIFEWVELGQGADSPVPYREMYDWRDLHRQFKALKPQLDGWVYWDGELRFAPWPEWQKIWRNHYLQGPQQALADLIAAYTAR